MEITINYYGQAVSVSVEVCEFLTGPLALLRHTGEIGLPAGTAG